MSSCQYCNKTFDDGYSPAFIMNHTMYYCSMNPNRDEKKLEQFKEYERQRMRKRVVCECGIEVCYGHLNKHRKTKRHNEQLKTRANYSEDDY